MKPPSNGNIETASSQKPMSENFPNEVHDPSTSPKKGPLNMFNKYKFSIIIAVLLIFVLGLVSFVISNKKSPPQQQQQQTRTPIEHQLPGDSQEVIVKPIKSSYKIASGNTSGWFKTGQNASIMLSGIDFNNTGGALLFNHPGKVATDGKHLLLADRNNNRVLIWNSLPSQNQKPDLVLGQENFESNNPGKQLNQLN
jgi:hypothetical protein